MFNNTHLADAPGHYMLPAGIRSSGGGFSETRGPSTPRAAASKDAILVEFLFVLCSGGFVTSTNRFPLPHAWRHLRLVIFTLGALLAVTALAVSPIHADTTITVTTNADELNSDGDCSLREAIQAANNNSATDNCAAGTGADIINFDNALGTATITIEIGDLTSRNFSW